MVQNKLKSKNVKIIFPSLITCFSMIVGFTSILASAEKKFVLAGVLILVAIILDGLDGKVARITNTASEFGIQLDSLSDLIAFGVAPAVLFYRYFLYNRVEQNIFHLLPAMFLLCGAIRLARFNVTASIHGKYYFTGLPIPAAAGALVVWIPLKDWMEQSGWQSLVDLAPYLEPDTMFRYAVAIIVITSLSMVSNMKFDTFNTFWFNLYPNRYVNYAVFIFFLCFLFIHFVVFMFAIMVYYMTVMYSRGSLVSLQRRWKESLKVKAKHIPDDLD